jgi:Flp pilus assembly protein TadB
MNATRASLILGAIPVAIAIIYFGVQALDVGQTVVDPAGAVLLLALGLSMGFGMLVILRGARDL